MTTLQKLLVLGGATAIGCLIMAHAWQAEQSTDLTFRVGPPLTNDWPKLTIRWDLEPWRQWNEKAAKEMKPEDMGIVNPVTIGHTLLIGPLANQMISSTNNVELGFRSDGVVVWRVPPEARP